MISMISKQNFARGFISAGFWINCLFLIFIDILGLHYVFAQRSLGMFLLMANFNLVVILAFYYAAWKPRRSRRSNRSVSSGEEAV